MGNYCCEEDSGKKSARSSQKPAAREQQPNQTLPPKQDAPKVNSSPNLLRHGTDSYQCIKYLGRGTFGDVVLAEDKENHMQYAMKIIDKRKIKEFNVLQCELIKTISVMELFVTIRETFQNENKIYIVMEYLPRGDIYFYLKRKEFMFKEEVIKMLLAEIIIGIEILHSEGIIYRELKPENILVTNDGHIKLTDYGLSKMIIEEKNPITTFIATLEYTAPEAIHGHYSKEVDLWAIGVLMHELRFEKNPFENNSSETNDVIQNSIEKTDIEDVLNDVVGLISFDFRDVLIRLLQKDPQKRITLEELKQHPFFEGVRWGDIPLRQNEPPLKHFLENDHIRFRDPTNEKELAHRKILVNKNTEFKANLYEFRSSE